MNSNLQGVGHLNDKIRSGLILLLVEDVFAVMCVCAPRDVCVVTIDYGSELVVVMLDWKVW